MTEPGGGLPVTPITGLLLGARFVLELALLAASAVAAYDVAGGGGPGVVAAGLAVAVVALVWGTFLSPRRRIGLPLIVRIVLELVLFALACAGLAVMGHGGWALVLGACEVVVLGLLRRPGEPVGRPSRG